jgi:hypothetical protein
MMRLNSFMIIRNYVTDGLKAQKHLAQGIALGLVNEFVRPARAKALIWGNAFAPSGRYWVIADNH